jgi:hypothetical protein
MMQRLMTEAGWIEWLTDAWAAQPERENSEQTKWRWLVTMLDETTQIQLMMRMTSSMKISFVCQ